MSDPDWVCRGSQIVIWCGSSVDWSEGTYEPVDAPLVVATVEAARDTTGERVFRRSATGGGDAKTLRNAGISPVEFALGTDTAHAVDERTTVDALVNRLGVKPRGTRLVSSVDTAVAYTGLPALLAKTLQNKNADDSYRK
jgi:succinyl-diaminopimelate desuccinylase